jgi:cytochrome bd-type quinol oxidase subunit 2
MGLVDPAARRRERGQRRSRRRRVLIWMVLLGALAAAFFIGVAVGRAVTEEPRPGGAQTQVRSLAPQTLSSPIRTVTVTTSTP